MTVPKTSTIVLSAVLFLVFLVLQFPFQNFSGYIFSKIYANTHILLVGREIYPSFFGWPGLGIKQVDVSLPVNRDEVDISASNLVFRVGIGSLIPPAPSVSLSMSGLKKGGDLFLRFSDTRTATSTRAEADDVQLEQIAYSALPRPISGKLNLDSSVKLDKGDLAKSAGDVSLAVDKLAIPPLNIQGFVLPALDIGNVRAKLQIRNGVVEIPTFQLGAPGSDLSGTISGDVRLGKDLLSSYANLTLRLQLSDSYRQNPQASLLVSLLSSFQGKTPGNYAMKWSASIGEMTTNLMSAIPQKVVD